MKRILLLASAFLMAVAFFVGCKQEEPAPSPTPEPEKPITATIVITSPSAAESTIAPGRHIKVSGTIEWSEMQDDATVRVSLLQNGNELRWAEACESGTGNVSKDWYKGSWDKASSKVEFDDISYTAPEFVTEGSDNLNSTLKCIYTEDGFYALIVSGSDKTHGNAMDDSFFFEDEDGGYYDTLPDGKYSIKVVITAADGTELGRAVKPITIGDSGLDAAISSETANSSAAKAIADASADCRTLNDLLPGEYGEKVEMWNISLAWATAYAEYICASTVRLYDYDIEDGSMTYNCAMASVLQKGLKIVNTDCYAFNVGEPSVAGKTGSLVKMPSSIMLCRVDNTKGASRDGSFVVSGSDISSTVTDFSSTVSVSKNSTYAVMGVTVPYLLESGEVVADTKACYYKYNNGISYLTYTFSCDGAQISQSRKDCGLKRSFDNGATYSSVAPLEFYHTFDSSSLSEGKTYQVSIQGYDKNDVAIIGMSTSFNLCVGEAPAPAGGNGTESMEGHPGAAWDN